MTARFKVSTLAMILAISIAACGDESTTPPPQGLIEGTVAVEGQGLDGVTVTLSDGMTTTTASGGSYRFTGVEVGSYTVTISGYPDDASFDAATGAATISAADQIVAVNFAGVYIRSAIILGRVSVEGDAVRDVTVRLTGVSDATATTDANGDYQFSALRKGSYTVEISDFAGDEIGFSNTSQTTSVGVGETKVLSFDGAYLRTAGILGQVTVGEYGIASVTITVIGEGVERATTTDDEGQYAINGLRAGDYQVELSDYDVAHYRFDEATKPVAVAQNEKSAVNFIGVKTRTASISGMLYLDENEKNDMYDVGQEESLAVAGVAVVLNGPSINDQSITVTNAEGQFLFDSLEAGQYRVLLSPQQDSSVATALRGLRHGGPATGTVLDVAGTSENSIHIPFDITHQTVLVTAGFGDGKKKVGGPVAGAEISLYATVNNAIAGRAPLGAATTDTTGTAEFYFERADDGDGVVFAVLDTLGHADLALMGDTITEIIYANTSRSTTFAGFNALNTRVTFRLAVRNIRTRLDGDKPRAGWVPEVVTDTTKLADTTMSTATLGEETDENGSSTYSTNVDADSLPMTLYVTLAADQLQSAGEKFVVSTEPSRTASSVRVDSTMFLAYTHDGLTPPGEIVDLGLLRIRFTTQTLLISLHYEKDHIPGMTYVGSLLGNDDREGAWLSGTVRLSVRDNNGDEILYPMDDNPRGVRRSGSLAGYAIFRHLPADIPFIVRYNANQLFGYTEASSAKVDTWRNHHEFSRGAFGQDGGANPLVAMCHQSTKADQCSTFAYVRINNALMAQAVPNSSRRMAMPHVTWRLVPVKKYNLSGVETRTRVQWDTVSLGINFPPGIVRWRDVPDGMYHLYAESEHKDWRLPTEPILLKMRANDDSDTYQELQFGEYLNSSISGTLVNDRNDDDEVSPDETQAGIELVLHSVTMEGSEYIEMPVDTAETGALGEFLFTRIPEGVYNIKVADTTLVLYSGAYDGVLVPGTSEDAIMSFVTDPSTREWPRMRHIDSRDMLPHWNYESSYIEDRDGFIAETAARDRSGGYYDMDFIILFQDGVLNGKVGPVAKADSARSVVISALRCWKVATSGTPTTCLPGEYDDPVGVHVSPEAGGNWRIEGLTEGYYEVRIAVSSDYVVSAGDPRLIKLEGRGARGTANYTLADPS